MGDLRSRDPEQSQVNQPREGASGSTGAPTKNPADEADANQREAFRPTLIIQRLLLPRPAPRLRLATTMTDAGTVPPALRRLWKANGFGIGRISRSRLELFLSNLPSPVDSNLVRIRNPSRYNALDLIKLSGRVQRVRIVDRDGHFRMLRFVGGDHQLLLKVATSEELGGVWSDADEEEGSGNNRDAESRFRLDLLPHHHSSTPSILPRSPRERMFDGESFDTLRLVQPLDRRHVWIVWADLPPLKTKETAPKDKDTSRDDSIATALEPVSRNEKKNNAAKPAPQGPSERGNGEKRAKGSEPLSLAEAMMAGRRGKRPMQIILLIGLSN